MPRMSHSMSTVRTAALGLAVISAATAVLPGPADAREFRRIRDVNVSCTNALRCDLFITNPRVTLFTVGFRRAAALDAPVALYLAIREPLVAGSQVRFVVDGIEVLTVPADAFSYRAALSEYSHDAQDAVRAMFAAARAGELLQVTYRTRTGQATAPFSLSGVVAGAIFMDEVQGRLGRDDALAAFGAMPVGPVAPVFGDDVRALDAVPAGLMRAFEGEGAPCAGEGRVGDVVDGFEVSLTDNVSLIGLQCGVGGAYNFPYAFWLSHREGHERIALPVMAADGPSAEMVAWNAWWDAEAGELNAFFKGRGLGDCGTVARWTLAGAEPRFVLREMRVKDACDGVFDETMESWPRLWPLTDDKS